MMDAMDCGADDFEAEGDCFTIYPIRTTSTPSPKRWPRRAIPSFPRRSRWSRVSTTRSSTDPDDITNMEKMLDILEDDDDVQNVWHNWDRD